MKVLIDPGHPGKTMGTEDPDNRNLREMDIVWAVGLALAILLEERANAWAFTHRQGEFAALSERAERTTGFDCMVSIHCNGFEDRSVYGTETCFYPGREQDEALAGAVQDELMKFWGTKSKDRGLKPRPDLTVLKRAECPAVLVELEFLTNQKSALHLADADTQFELARALDEGIRGWWRKTLHEPGVNRARRGEEKA